MTKVDIGVFAHNEAEGIAAMVAGLQAQRLDGLDARIVILANGCRDATVAIARAEGAEVLDLPEAGKSRTWNRFVHDLSRRDADCLLFVDADIQFLGDDSLKRLTEGLVARPELWVLNSQPVKDTVHHSSGRSLTDRLIAAGSGGLDDWKTAICGQLYAMPASCARQLHLPIGLPVEDGFLRAMVLTDALVREEDFRRIDGLDGLAHVYAAERSVGALIRHQTRIVIGSAINFAAFGYLRSLPPEERSAELSRAAKDEGWIRKAMQGRLPRAPFGYVPFHFLTKRLIRLGKTPRHQIGLKRIAMAILGTCFDAVVYVRAQYKMLRGAGAGYW